MASKTEYFKLNDGNKIPAIGLGTFQGAYTYESVDEHVIQAVGSAIDAGYRHIDTAPLYETERAIGTALQAKIATNTVKRKDVFITSKLWCTHHATKDVVPALKQTLADLGLSYIDLWLVHWPISIPNKPGVSWPVDSDGATIFNDDEVGLLDTWKGMEECKSLGLSKSIGVSNFNVTQLQEILDKGTVKPAVNQVERHVFFSNQNLVDFCHQNGIHVTCYSPLGKTNRPWKKPGDPAVFDNPVLIDIAKKYGKSPAQIFDFLLNEADRSAIKALDQNFRMLYLRERLGHSKQYPF